jgi:hypothetical protein
MNTLSQLQGDFQACVLKQNGHFSGQIVSSAAAGAEERLAVYQHAYRLRLLEVLENDFPALRGIAGADRFRELGERYIAAHPSTSRSVRQLGAHLATFIRSSLNDAAAEAWGEMAEFEWLKSAAFDAADAPLASIADLARLAAEDWPPLHLRFHPSLQRIELLSNTPQRWRAVTDGAVVPAVEPFHPPQSWIIWRAGLDVHWRPLEPDEGPVLDAIRFGSGFVHVCGMLDAWLGDESQAAMRAASLLKRWLDEGLVSALDV